MAALVDQVDGGRLMADCAGFARYVKLSGTAPELESLTAVQAALAAAGFRTTMLRHDAYISLPGEARVTVDGAPLTAITHSFSRPSPAGGLSAPVVDLKTGSDADFARLAAGVRGAIVLVDGIASPAVAARAAAAGAVGQLHVSPHEHLHEMCISPVWGSPSAETLGQLPQTVACTISLAEGAALRARMAAGAAPEVVLHAAVDTGWRETPILQADMDGPDPDGPFILFSGHHDTWFYGVMDNGSANATMLETARVLATRRDDWKRGLRLCFWSGHSHGRYSGSSWYVDTHWAELEARCAVHVNVDSTGGIGATVMTETAVPAELRALGAEAVLAETAAVLEGKRPNRNSDMSFWGVGIPSMFGSMSHQPPSTVAMRNPLGWWWHTPHDTLDKVDAANLVRDTRVFVRTIWRLLTDAALPLDFAAHARALTAELRSIEAGLAGRLSLTPLFEAAAALETEGSRPATDAALMAASRALVPADYTEGDRFAHDPALPLPPWPVLQPIRALAAAAEGDAMRFARVGALRARNRMQHALTEALRALARR
ncbi:MAG: M28 family metallopeptidase [Janthinobacterium lividum]